MLESSLDINGFDLYGHWPGGIATPVNILSFSIALEPPQWARTSSLSRLHDHTQSHHIR